MNKIFIIFILIISGYVAVHGQQDPVYSQYMFDKILINPAYAGSSNWVVTTLKHRRQFEGMEGAPITNLLTFHAPIQTKNMGLGLKLVQDNIAVSQILTLKGLYSYHIGFGSGKLSFGLEAGVINNVTNYDRLIRVDQDDQAIPGAGEAAFMPDASFGLYFQNQKYYLGATVNHLFSSTKSVSQYQRNELVKTEMDYYGLAGYIFNVTDALEIEPGIMIKYLPGIPVQADGYINLTFWERITIGTSYRRGDAISFLCRIVAADNFRIGYSYDYTLSGLADFSHGSHEIMITYGLELLAPPAKKVVHPRYYF